MIILNKTYKILQQIRSGLFSDVYEAKNVKSHQEVIIKVINHCQMSLEEIKKEVIIHKKLDNFNYVPKLLFYEHKENSSYLVIEKNGIDLERIKQNNGNINLKNTILIAIEMLNILKNVHINGVIHQDIKPSNIIFDANIKNNQLFLIDFGLAKFSLEKHSQQKENNIFIGSLQFSSRNAHKGIILTEKDDLESLGYILVYLFIGKLPWEKYCSDVNNIKKIGKMKEKAMINKFIDFLPWRFHRYFELVEEMNEFNEEMNEFNEENYNSLIDCFNQLALENDIEISEKIIFQLEEDLKENDDKLDRTNCSEILNFEETGIIAEEDFELNSNVLKSRRIKKKIKFSECFEDD